MLNTFAPTVTDMITEAAPLQLDHVFIITFITHTGLRRSRVPSTHSTTFVQSESVS